MVYDVMCLKCDKEGWQCEDCKRVGAGSNGVSNIHGAPGDASAPAVGMIGGTVNGVLVARTGVLPLRFIPQQTGLTEPWVTVLNLAAHTNYTFRIVALNGVTHLSNELHRSVMVNITTNQAGRRHC